ncbi:MAG: AI-2E family transporter [Lewinellaceae bacterium]|nr:AI-2E family transporter [Lewinellaceae bacterium]
MYPKNRIWLWLIGALVLGAIVYYFSDILTYILLAWVLSMLGRPLMNFLQNKIRFRRWKMGAAGAAVMTILGFYLFIACIILLFVPTIVEQTRNLAGVDYAALGQKLEQPFADLDQSLHRYGLLEQGESLSTRIQMLLSTVFKPTLLGDVVTTVISAAGSLLVTFAVVTFILFFFLKDSNLFNGMLRSLVPNELEDKVMRTIEESSKMLTRYFGGLVIQIAFFTTILSLLLWIMGVENALLIGAFGGLLNVVPYVGPIMGAIFASFITVSSHLDMEFDALGPLLLKVLFAFGATQFTDNNFLAPVIFSKSVKAHPLEIFLVTLIAAKLGGVIGMVLGIPVYTVLRVIASIFFSEFKLVKKLTQSMKEKESAVENAKLE